MQAPSPLKPLSPRTKWLIALCLCALVMLLEFLTYHMAYRIGYDEGMLTTPPVVVQKSDEKAMQNLSRFMADVFASRESLAGILDNREERLAWIRDPELRTETAWGLTRELISRGGVVLALPAARELIDAGYAAGHYRVWAPRADAVAKALLAEHQYTSAYDYLKTAEEGYEKEGMAEPLVRTLQTMSSIDQMLNRNEQANMLLQRAVDAAAHLGTDALPVRSRLMAAQGRLARATGRIPESRAYFKKALALCPQPDKTTGDLALASISMGEAMLEAGRKDEARELFLKGLTGSENASYLLNDCLNALRGLARISTEQGIMRRPWLIFTRRRRCPRRTADGPCLGPGCMIRRGGSTSCARPLGSPGGFLKAIANSSASPVISAQSREGLGKAWLDAGRGARPGRTWKGLFSCGSPISPRIFCPWAAYIIPGTCQRYGGDRRAPLTAYAGAVDSLLKCVEGRNAGICWFSLICARHTPCATESSGRRPWKLLKRCSPCWRGNSGRRITSSLAAVTMNWE
ncbi:MAG: tetratricopeptide repeat protein [Akkermansia sp.]